ncbi:FXSXX-COOH protein [Salinibacterium sp. NYA9b]
MSMSDESPVDGLMSRLSLIEDQPLETRAAAFTQVHDELQQQLEGKDAFSRNG